MKTLLKSLLLLFSISAASHAFTSTLISTSSLQSGATIYVSSGTVIAMRTGSLVSSGTVNLGGSANSVTISTNVIFSPTTAGILGTTTNDSAAAGNVGQYIESVTGGANVGASTHYVGVSTITLTAGDWDVSGVAVFSFGGTTGNTDEEMLITSTSGDNATGGTSGSNYVFGIGGTAGVTNMTLVVPSYRVSLSGSTIYYLKVMSTYSTGTPTCSARISARRIR